MAQDLIPTSDKPFYTQRTTLEGREFVLEFTYNQREDVTYLSILDTANVLIRGSIKIITNRALLSRYKYDTRLPPGDIYAFSFTTDAPPAFGELGETKRVRLVYFNTEEQESLGLEVGAT